MKCSLFGACGLSVHNFNKGTERQQKTKTKTKNPKQTNKKPSPSSQVTMCLTVDLPALFYLARADMN